MEKDNENKTIISEATPIRIGLVILFLGAFAGAIWWASSITSKLDTLLTTQNTTLTTFTELKSKDISLDKEISDMKLRVALDEVAIKALQDKLSNQVK